MDYLYFPGCTLYTKAKNFDQTARNCSRLLGFELKELKNWTCCGATFPLATDNILALLPPSRILATAREEGTALTTLCATVLSRLAHQFSEKGVAVAMHVPADLPQIKADEDRINQVMTNLIGNALQYTPRGGHVTVAAAHDGHEIRVSVQDDGIGIPAEDLPHIFDRFYRVDKSRSRVSGGSGIGLTIAKYFVEAHGGRIRAESAGVGKGSTFTFTLPVE